MKMISMEKSEESMQDCKPVSCEHDKYPYGIRLHLDDECVKKLGIKDLPKVGDKMMIQAVAYVCDASEHMVEGKGTRKSIGLQICEMGVSESKQKKEAADEMYEEDEGEE